MGLLFFLIYSIALKYSLTVKKEIMTTTYNLKLLLVVFFICNISFAQHAKKSNDSLTHKEHRKEVKAERKATLKASHKRFVFKGISVFANLSTDMVFGIPYTDDLLSANLSLEDNFGLEDHKTFFSGSFLYFITPRSGLYAHYYGINRENSHKTQKEYTFLGQTIPAGTDITAYFNTHVFSFGYLLTIMRDSKVFFGAYFNIFFMDLQTGVYTKGNIIDENIEFLLPLPNFGLIANFELLPWLYFDASVGFFALDLKDSYFSGSIYNVNAALVFKPLHWFGVSLSYEMFNVDVSDRYDIRDTYIPYSVNYHFTGPAVGVSFNF
jgi:hypothetical protein